MAKASALDADTVVYDLEDAVASSAKADARQALVAHLSGRRPGSEEVVIRINGVDAGDLAVDLDAVAQARPDAILLPKVGSVSDLLALADRAAAAALPPDLRLWLMVETASGLAELDSIVEAGLTFMPRLDCLVVGTNDIAKETGILPGNDRCYLVPWLMNIVLVAKRRRIAVLDGVWNDFRDQDGFELEARQGKNMGFDGKTLIHPTQVEIANRVFLPDPDAIDDAMRIVAVFSLPQHASSNVVNLDGRMVERLHLEQAWQLLARARAAGLLAG